MFEVDDDGLLAAEDGGRVDEDRVEEAEVAGWEVTAPHHGEIVQLDLLAVSPAVDAGPGAEARATLLETRNVHALGDRAALGVAGAGGAAGAGRRFAGVGTYGQEGGGGGAGRGPRPEERLSALRHGRRRERAKEGGFSLIRELASFPSGIGDSEGRKRSLRLGGHQFFFLFPPRTGSGPRYLDRDRSKIRPGPPG